ncbi:MAG: peptidase family, partial [candidate division NC10 bacterium]|nr:peptidase family [candidate division NC10 bacterium]
MTVGLSLGSFQAWRIVLLVLLLLTIPGSPEAADPFGLQGRVPRTAQQGGVFALTLRPAAWIEDLRGSLDNQPLILSPIGDGRVQALVGIDLEARGRRLLRLEANDRRGRLHAREWPIRVRSRRFAVQRLTLPQHMVELDPETATRVSEEAGRLKALWKAVTPERLWRGAFLSPVISGAKPEGFGLRRIINNQPRSPHSGADYKAAPGSVVRAPNAARVALAEEQFFAGNALVLDHGLGLYTIYFHLQEFTVKTGDVVQKGQEIGRVGATGRATGPHLHFGVRLNGARI